MKEIRISKEDIKKLRTNYSLSLDDFSKIIGCAKKTLISYEQGISIPNDNYLVILKTLKEDPELITYFIESNKERFSDKEFNRIIKKINNFIDGKNINISSIKYINNNMNIMMR